jgi:16S rRNA (guanine527-N7)-methyltransferase
MPARELPDLPLDEFARRLAAVSPAPLAPEAVAALHAHYRELRRWNRTVSLIGPGTLDEIFPRHYGESLAALPLVAPGDRVLVDVGSGAGFPGFVLAAARPDLDATLIEARQRKWAFLRAAARRAALPCRCLNARVVPSLPAELPRQADLVTLRALKPTVELLGLLAGRLSPAGRILLWLGGELPPLPSGLARGGERPLPGSVRRRLVELRPEGL